MKARQPPRRVSSCLNPFRAICWLFIACTSLASSAPAADPGLRARFDADVWPVLDRYCLDCHADGADKGNFNFDDFLGVIDDVRTAERWHEVINVLNEGRMPPEDKRQPSPDEKVTVVEWARDELARAELALAGSAEGVLRRINRREYEHTIQALLGVPPIGTGSFAKDGAIEGLDNQGPGLFMSPYQMERFLDTALATLESAIPDETWPRYHLHLEGEELEYNPHKFVYAHHFPDPLEDYREELAEYEALPDKERRITDPPKKPRGKEIPGLVWAHENDHPTQLIEDRGIVVYHPINSRAQLIIAGAKLMVPLAIPRNGWYRVRIKAGAGPPTAFDQSTLTVGLYEYIGGRGGAQNRGHNPLLKEEVRGTIDQPESIEKLIYLKQGQRRYYLHKGNLGWETDVYNQPDMYTKIHRDRIPRREIWRGLFIDDVEIEGPIPAKPAIDLLFPDGVEPPFTTEKTHAALKRLASRAFRRPVSDAEIERYTRFHDGSNRQTFIAGVRQGAAMILASPKFVYLVEKSAGPGDLSPLEVASRLSYFLWNEGPDEELLRKAESNELATPEGLRKQTRRLLADPRSSRFIRSFAEGWLGLDRLETIIPDRRRFPNYTFDMPETLVGQTTAFVEEILRSDRSSLDVIDSDWDMLNAKLARYYGLDHLGIAGTTLRPVRLAGDDRVRRGGVLAHASILAMTSNGTRTSPVVRGAWITEHLLGDPPPPPPPSVSALEEIEGVSDTNSLTVKQLIELHTRDPDCAACHKHFDPYGIAFENYDAAGQWRNQAVRFIIPERGNRPHQREPIAPIDAAGVLADGTPFDGPASMKAYLLSRKDDFARHLAEKMLAYAIGRPVDFSDRPEIRQLETVLAENDYRLEPLIEAIVLSETFKRR